MSEQAEWVEAAEPAYDGYGALPHTGDLHGRIEADLTSGKSPSELPAWEGVE